MLRSVACPAEGGAVAATVDDRGRVALWSLEERRSLAEWEAAAERVAVAGDGVVVASAVGVRGHDDDARERWARDELRQVRVLRPLAGGFVVAVTRELHVLDALTGTDVARFAGLGDLFGGDGGEALGIDRIGGLNIELLELPEGTRLWRTKLAAYGVVDAAVGAEIALAETAGAVRVFDLRGGEQWRWTPPRGEHVARVAWLPGGFLAAVLSPFARTVGAVLAVLEPGGGLVTTHDLGRCVDSDFLPDGRGVVVARADRAELLRVPDAAVIWTFGT